MRDTFLSVLTEEARQNRDVVLLTADLGFGVFEKFEEEFPGQYFNVGVAEQNMIGVATGLALEGKKVLAYSIGNFPTLRCLEQIRNDACYHGINLTIISSGGGFSYGGLGMSHHATEDLAILRALPELKVVAPATTWEAGEATRYLINAEGVGYIRLDKTAAKETEEAPKNYILGKARRLREGKDISLICTGGITSEAQHAAEEAEAQGIYCSVISMHTVKPLDEAMVLDAAHNTGGIITIEEHNIIGGLGSAVAEVCIENGVLPRKFKRIGLNDVYSSVVGSQDYLRAHYNMDKRAILRTILEFQKA